MHQDKRRQRVSGRVLFLNVRSCGSVQQLDLVDRYLMEHDVEYAVLTDPRLTATSPLGSKNYELIADEKSRYYVCFAIRRRTREQRPQNIQPELIPIAERAAALHIPELRLILLGVYGMPMTRTHTDKDRSSSWTELHARIREQMQGETAHIMAGGDLNAHICAVKLREGGHPGHERCTTRATDANGKAVLGLCKDLSLQILNYARPMPNEDYTTYIGNSAIRSSTVDYVCGSEEAVKHVEAIRLTKGRKPYGDMTDHKGILVQWRHDSAKRARVAWEPRVCPFTDGAKAEEGSPEEKYDHLVELLAKKKTRTGESGKQTEIVAPSNSMQRLLDRRAALLGLSAGTTRDAQLGGVDKEIEVLAAGEEKEKWEAVEKDIAEALTSGASGNVLKVIEKYFGAPRRKLYVSKKSKEMLVAHVKSVVSPGDKGPQIGMPTEDIRTLMQMSVGPGVGGVEDWTEEIQGEAIEDVYTDTSYGMAGALHRLTWAAVGDEGRLLYCGPVPYATFGAGEATVRIGEDWAILEAMARQPGPIRVHTDSKHSVKEHNNWGKLVRSEFQKTEGGDSQILRTMHEFMRGRKAELIYEEGHTSGTLSYMAHVGARFAAKRGIGTCLIEIPEGLNWSQVCSMHKTEYELWSCMDKWRTVPVPVIDLEATRVRPQRMSDATPTIEEIILSLQDIPASVSRGYDDIGRGDFLSDAEQLNVLWNLIVSIWENRSLPHKLRRIVMVCVTKDRSVPLGPANCRGLSLLSVVIKVLNNIIRRRLQRLPTSDTQIGFVPGHNVQQGIQVLKAFVEALRAEGAGAVLVFVDLHKAFDCVSRINLRALLYESGFSETAAELLMQLWEHEIVLRFPNGDYSEAFHPTRGTMQGLGLSPIIFTLVMEAVMRQTHTQGVHFFSKRTGRMHCFKHMAYADDLVVVCRDAASAEAFLDSLALNLQKYGLSINTTKTKVMGVAPRPEQSTQMPVAQAEANAISRGMHASQLPGAAPCGIEVRQSIVTFFGGKNGKETLVVKTLKGADALVCPHPRCGVVIERINRNTGQQYSTEQRVRLKLHVQDGHRVDMVEVEAVGRITESQLRRCESYGWPRAPLYDAVLQEKMTQFERRVRVTHKGALLEEVATMKYLGAMVDATNSMDPEINARAAACTKAFFKIPRGLWTSSVSTRQKAAVYRSVVLSVAFFGAEAWVLTNAQEKTMDVLVTTQLRTVTGLHAELVPHAWDSTRHDFRVPRVEAVWRSAQIPRITHLLIRARLRLAGQWMRMHAENELAALAHVTTVLGERGSWWKQVHLDAERVGLTLNKAMNKVEWEKALKVLGKVRRAQQDEVNSDAEEEDVVDASDDMEEENMEDDPDDLVEEWEEMGGEGLDAEEDSITQGE